MIGYFLCDAQYRGIGPLSTGIKLFTRSKWSHSASVLVDTYQQSFYLTEAWGTKGVVDVEADDLITVLSANHHPDTPVDVFRLAITRDEYAATRKFLQAQVGKKYDWALIKKFVTRQSAEENGRWICSELTGEAYRRIYKPMQRMESWKMAPEHCGISEIVEPWLSVVTV